MRRLIINDFNISGHLLQAYFICKRQAWLLSRCISQQQDNDYLAVGRLINETTYLRNKKEIAFANIKLDILKTENNCLIIGEVKKSSRGIEAAKQQLLLYLYKLKAKGVIAKGEILVPKEKKKERVELTPEAEAALKKDMEELEKILSADTPPALIRGKYCAKCAYNEFCWAEVV